ncbi:hypothetical protein LguiA_036239 [Lonicera macranthoides]
MALDLLQLLWPHVSSSHIYTRSIYFSQQPSSDQIPIEKNQRKTRHIANKHKKERSKAR